MLSLLTVLPIAVNYSFRKLLFQINKPLFADRNPHIWPKLSKFSTNMGMKVANSVNVCVGQRIRIQRSLSRIHSALLRWLHPSQRSYCCFGYRLVIEDMYSRKGSLLWPAARPGFTPTPRYQSIVKHNKFRNVCERKALSPMLWLIDLAVLRCRQVRLWKLTCWGHSSQCLPCHNLLSVWLHTDNYLVSILVSPTFPSLSSIRLRVSQVCSIDIHHSCVRVPYFCVYWGLRMV